MSVKKLECLDIKIIIKTKENEKIVNVDDKEENVNEEITLQNDEHDDNIELDGIDWERWRIWWEKNYNFGSYVIYYKSIWTWML